MYGRTFIEWVDLTNNIILFVYCLQKHLFKQELKNSRQWKKKKQT